MTSAWTVTFSAGGQTDFLYVCELMERWKLCGKPTRAVWGPFLFKNVFGIGLVRVIVG
jgi:hypothetical protein